MGPPEMGRWAGQAVVPGFPARSCSFPQVPLALEPAGINS